MWLLSAHGQPVSGQVSMSCSSCRVSNDIRLVWNKDMGIGYIAMRNKLSYDCDIVCLKVLCLLTVDKHKGLYNCLYEIT